MPVTPHPLPVSHPDRQRRTHADTSALTTGATHRSYSAHSSRSNSISPKMPRAPNLSTGISPTRLQQVRLVLTCFSIAANALTAGGIFIFPLLSPGLASRLKLTQPQLTTIVLAGMVGQYLLSPLIGKIFDSYGPRTCSFIASVMFALGFSLFSNEISRTPNDIVLPNATSFYLLVILFFVIGLATVFSYFSSIFTASINFPEYPGIASGSSMALFGLSPLFLSLIASRFFTIPVTGLDITHFLNFMAIFCGSIHLIGTFTLRTRPLTNDLAEPFLSDAEEHLIENSPLLQEELVEPKPTSVDQTTFIELLREPCFWILLPTLGISLGLCEMVISNMGSIVLSLSSLSPTSPGIPSIDIATSTQVRIFSTANTVSRLVVGPIADFMSPISSGDHESRRCRVSRVSFISSTILLLFMTFVWMDVGIRSQEDLWTLSTGTGIVYGATWTILPGVLSSIWGSPDLGRNFGIVSYAPVVGTPIFSYLYAFVSDHYAQDGGICIGVICWQLTFLLASLAAMLAFCGTLILQRLWKGRI